MNTGEIPAAMLWLGQFIYYIYQHFISADLGNAVLEFIGGCLIWLHSIRTWKDEEIKGVSVWPFVFFWTWGIYNCWYYAHIGQPISGAVAFMPALANSAFLFSYWLFAGPFNYDRRRDRIRWWLVSRINRLLGKFCYLGEAVLEAADLPTRTTAALPEKQCNVCGMITKHDLDGHCIICDTKG